MRSGGLLLGVDTCGVSGSIALGRVTNLETESGGIELLAERTLASGDYASTLVSAAADLLDETRVSMGGLAGITVVAGPGSFTGIRIGIAAVKAFAEAASLPLVSVSRLALLAEVAKEQGVQSAVLDAHRGQVFCGLYEAGQEGRELLLTAGEINSMGGLPLPIAVCEEAVAQMLAMLLEVEPTRVAAPTAWNALIYSLAKWKAQEFADVASLDGYYLRGADAKMAVR